MTNNEMHLNIPLSTNQSTRPRFIKGRVLWILGGWLVFIFVSCALTNLWFARDTLSAHAPDGTMAVIHLTLSRQAWTKIINDFDDLSLVSQRPLTISDLTKFKPKEISIFILENNESAVAIRTNERNLNKKNLDSYGINLQKLGQNRWLLSNQPLPYSTKTKTEWSFGSIWPGTIGTVKLDDFSGRIIISKNNYSVELSKTKKTGEYLPTLPDSVIAAVALQPLANLNLSSVFERMNVFLEPTKLFETKQIGKKIEEKGGLVILTDSGFLLETNLNLAELSQIIKTAAVLRNLTIEPLNMPDGSLVQEILINQTEIDFGSIWIDGQEIKSVQVGNDQFLALEGQETDIIASNQVLLEEYLKKKQEKNNENCGPKDRLVFLKPKELINAFLKDKNFIETPALINFALKFDKISLNTNNIHFCY